MSDYSILFDVAKVRQQELAREFEISRIHREARKNRKPVSMAKKLRTLLTSIL